MIVQTRQWHKTIHSSFVSPQFLRALLLRLLLLLLVVRDKGNQILRQPLAAQAGALPVLLRDVRQPKPKKLKDVSRHGMRPGIGVWVVMRRLRTEGQMSEA